jgi:hypothetical protein
MFHFEQVAAGLSILSGYAREQNCQLTHRSLGDKSSCYIEIRKGNHRVDFTLSEEYLADLPAMKEWHVDVRKAFWQFSKRLSNPFPDDFYASSGTPFNAEFRWPLKMHPSRDVFWLHGTVVDLRFPKLVGKIAPAFSGPLLEFELKHKPFKLLEVLVNSIRTAFDNSSIEFYEKNGHPNLLQEIPIFDMPVFSRFSDPAIGQFLAGKVNWLAFQRANKAGAVWIADPWDAEYLGVSVHELIRAAEILQARGLIEISRDGDFASATDLMIASVHTSPTRQTRPIGFNT